MRAAVYEAFEGPLTVRDCADPAPAPHGVVLDVQATGICRSDWHGWRGHDPDIRLPHVPGHELAGVVVAAGRDVRAYRGGERVTVPFVCGCGDCRDCRAGHQQVCARQTQPGFTHWGSYAQYVAIDHADVNLVPLPESLDFVTAASLGCRFATAYRAVVAQGKLRAGEFLAVHGCGGVGLSAVMIGVALGARVIAIDVDAGRLALARDLGAIATVDASRAGDVAAAVAAASEGGAELSLDAFGSAATCRNSILGLRRRGRHVQVGLLTGDEREAPLPMAEIIARELCVVGSHGMQAPAYAPMLGMIADGRLSPGRLVARRVSLEDAAAGFGDERYLRGDGITVIDRFGRAT